MKLTKETLKRIIKEELDAVVNEEDLDEGLFDFFKGKKKEEPKEEEPVKQLRPVAQLIKDSKANTVGLNQTYIDYFDREIDGFLMDQNGRLVIDPDSEDHEDYLLAKRIVRSIDRWASKKEAWVNRRHRRSSPQQVERWEQSDPMKLGYGGNRNPTYEQAKAEADVMWKKWKEAKKNY